MNIPPLRRHAAVAVLKVKPHPPLVQGQRTTLVTLPSDVLRNTPQAVNPGLDLVNRPFVLVGRHVGQVQTRGCERFVNNGLFVCLFVGTV